MKKTIKIIMRISFIFYVIILIALLFLRTSRFTWGLTFIEYLKYSTNLIPFRTISTYVRAIFDGSINLDIPIKNLMGNLILFLPMGTYLPYFTRRLDRVKPYSIAIIFILFAVEVIQAITRRGSFDIDDFILNMIGALIGFTIWKTKFVQRILNAREYSSYNARNRII